MPLLVLVILATIYPIYIIMSEVDTHFFVYCIYTAYYLKHIGGTLGRTESEKTQKIPSHPTHGNPHSPIYKHYHWNYFGLGRPFLIPLF